jgi:hypothetical protein
MASVLVLAESRGDRNAATTICRVEERALLWLRETTEQTSDNGEIDAAYKVAVSGCLSLEEAIPQPRAAGRILIRLVTFSPEYAKEIRHSVFVLASGQGTLVSEPGAVLSGCRFDSRRVATDHQGFGHDPGKQLVVSSRQAELDRLGGPGVELRGPAGARAAATLRPLIAGYEHSIGEKPIKVISREWSRDLRGPRHFVTAHCLVLRRDEGVDPPARLIIEGQQTLKRGLEGFIVGHRLLKLMDVDTNVETLLR